MREHDTAALYDWLMLGFSLQGISDAIATGYIAEHGNATWAGISGLLETTRCACPKLAGFAAYRDCSYRKALATCSRPQHLRLCPVRRLPLRKGALNVQAFSLHLFLRDVCAGNLIGFLDSTISMAQREHGSEWVAPASDY